MASICVLPVFFASYMYTLKGKVIMLMAQSKILVSLWGWLCAFMIFGGAEPARTPKLTGTCVDDTTVSLEITIPADPDHYVYADTIQISTDSPAIKLSAWRSTVDPITRYDTVFKENRRVFQESPVLRLTATRGGGKTTAGETAKAFVHLTYYTNKDRAAHEELFPLDYGAGLRGAQAPHTASKNEPSESQPVGASSAQVNEHTTTRADAASATEARTSLLEYMKHAAQASSLLWIRVLIAFALGLLMSLTPCIYPMIPITVGILQAQQTKGTPSFIRNFGLACSYTLGISATFALMGLAASWAGQAFGSFMTHPLTILLIVALMIYSAFSLFGFYEIYVPKFLSSHGGGKGGSIVSAFVFGTISGTVASPCLSPGLVFMLTLVATLKSAVAGFVLLFAFAIGLSLPLLIIGTFSGSLAMAPRAGSWMVEVKQFLGFVLLGMCFYFIAPLVGPAALYALLAIFLFGVGLFYAYHARSYVVGPAMHILSGLGALFIIGATLAAGKAFRLYVAQQTHGGGAHEVLAWNTDYRQALTSARQRGTKLFVLVHAPRCLACQELSRMLEASPRAQNALKNIVALACDISKRGNASTRVIEEKFSVMGAPTCLLIDERSEKVLHRWDGEFDEEEFEKLVATLEDNRQ